jgi:hypothetical protein
MGAVISAGQRSGDSRNAQLNLLVCGDELDQWVRDALRQFVSRGRRFSVKELSNKTGVPDRMIESAIAALDSEDFRPLKREYLFSILKFLGAQFTTELLLKVGQGAFDLPETEPQMPGELVAECANDTAEVAHRAADGEFCPDDHRALKSIGQRSVARGMEMIAAAREWVRDHSPRRSAAA